MLAAELRVEALLDAACDISSLALGHTLDALTPGAKLKNGRPVVRETEPLDEATAAALAPILEAVQLLVALDKLTAVSV